ncbi:MAG: ATP-binding protein [Candidatus Omnitrophica bacterium]|nr:ATP-binding protein [Candidatus Omnitrophota bacterium]
MSQAREKARSFLRQVGFPDDTLEKLLVALGEGCTNSIRHSYGNQPQGRIEITLEDFKDKVVIKIRDFGEKIDFSKVKEPELPPKKPHGLGLYFIKTIMDQFEYNTSHTLGNELIMIKYKSAKEKPHENQD